jgi:hypothetical protein
VRAVSFLVLRKHMLMAISFSICDFVQSQVDIGSYDRRLGGREEKDIQ